MFSLSAFDLTPSKAVGREWLLSNGAGGYASSTAIGMNARKYHGLLVAPLSGASNRHVLLAKVEETASCNGKEFPLSTNAYQGATYPTGFSHQTGFSFSSHPVFSYSLEGARLEKSVRMPHGKDAVVVSYRLISGREVLLSVRPMLSLRQIHADPKTEISDVPFEPDRAGFEIISPAKMRMSASHGKFTPLPQKFHNMVYPAERERGYAFLETLFSPGVFSAKLSKGEELHICASVSVAQKGSPPSFLSPSDALDILDRQAMRFSHLAGEYSRLNGIGRTDFSDALLRAADSFAVSRQGHYGIAAGFHWFSEWGRDAMISLPGLLLCTGRFAFAREVLAGHAERMKDGLLPNFIDEQGNAHYNSADASLWFVNAVREFAENTGDYEFVRARLWKGIRSFLSNYMQGNPLVAMDSDCLLAVKEPSATWMDAKIAGNAVTPRKGKPVEINALWHSDLRFIAELAERFGDSRTAGIALRAAEGAKESFSKFLCANDGSLFDVIEPADASMRPNQIFAVSLPHSPLNHIQKEHVFNVVRSSLYTPLGLRTLSPHDRRCQERYSGNQEARDSAYHQGMIWPWLLGAFYDAQLAVRLGSARQVLSSLRPFADAMGQGCAGSIPEIYEPATMKPAGAVSQAWSVAEVLRIYTKVKKADVPVSEADAQKAGMIA